MNLPAGELLTSLRNPRVQRALRLWKRRERDCRRETLIEGDREITRALEGGVVVRTLFFCPALLPAAGQQVLGRARDQGAALCAVDRNVFQKLVVRKGSDGLLAVAEQPLRALETLSPGQRPLLVVVEGVEKPGNLGAILRSADAAGAGGIIVCDPTTDIYNPNVVRASLGTVFSLPVVQAITFQAISWLKTREIAIVAATPSAGKLYTDVDLRPALALAMGSEQAGLSAAWLQAADARVRIPMRGHADSLNLAMATTVLLFEAVRQRTT